jgi:hypothetical protein
MALSPEDLEWLDSGAQQRKARGMG